MRHIVISGGSRGLGFGVVQRFISAGCRVSTFARSVSKDLRAALDLHTDQLFAEAVDICDLDAVEDFLDRSSDRFGPPTVVINNCALGQDSLLTHTAPEKIEQIMVTNVVRPLQMTRICVRQMIRHNVPGRVINISSICGSRGFAGLTAYSASKGALDAFTRSLARELGPRGILVNSVAPGFFESEMSEVLSAEQRETIRRRSATGKLTVVDEVVRVVEFLAGEEVNITGQVITIDGGTTA